MLYRKIAVAGATAAVIVGAGTAALAASGSDSTGGAGTTATAQQHAKKTHNARKQRRHQLLRHLVHGQVVTHNNKNGYVVHSGIRGTVSSVSATSITVKAADGFTQTFTIGKDTKVREREAGKKRAVASSASHVKSGDHVAVLGKAAEKSSSKSTAVVVVDGIRK